MKLRIDVGGNAMDKLQKVQKNAEILNTLWTIALFAVVFVFISSIRYTFGTWNADEKAFTTGTSIWENLLEIHGSYIDISGDNQLRIYRLQDKSEVKIAILVWQVLTCVGIFFYFIPLLSLKKILNAVLEGNPFGCGISKSIMTLGWSVVGIQLFSASMYTLSSWICTFFIDDFRHEVSFIVKSEWIFVWFFAATLSSVFAYGEELQRQADETI